MTDKVRLSVDNSLKISAFMPEEDDGDTFFYTELIDRKPTKGGNRMRIIRTYFHNSRDKFWEHWPVIKKLCDQNGVRAYTRLSPRSYKTVGKLFAETVLRHALDEQWKSMVYSYASSCGLATPVKKLWLLDVDVPVLTAYQAVEEELILRDALVTIMPSRAGFHIVIKPHLITYDLMGLQLHKDQPTNLYIPENAE
jgi:hypothetical protein